MHPRTMPGMKENTHIFIFSFRIRIGNFYFPVQTVCDRPLIGRRHIHILVVRNGRKRSLLR